MWMNRWRVGRRDGMGKIIRWWEVEEEGEVLGCKWGGKRTEKEEDEWR